MYADDTTLLSTFQSFGEYPHMGSRISLELEKYDIWLRVNKLSLTVSKTKMMNFKAPQKQLTPPIIRLNGTEIENVSNFNFLGIVFDQKLSWHDHVQYISAKISRTIGVLNRLKHLLPK